MGRPNVWAGLTISGARQLSKNSINFDFSVMVVKFNSLDTDTFGGIYNKVTPWSPIYG